MTMPTLDAKSLLADPAPIWFDDLAPGHAPAPDDAGDTVPGGFYADPLQAALAQVDAARQRPALANDDRQRLALADDARQRPALAVVPPPAADPLAMALPWLVRHLGVAAAVEAAVGPVHEDRPLPSDDVLPALRSIGFDAHLQRRSLASLTAADLPTVLLLNSGDACVLTARWQDAQGQAQCSVVLPGPQPDEFDTAEAEIEPEYSGVALLVNPPRPPFASALARARAGAGGGAGAASAAAAAPAAGAAIAPPMADALVALAAAVQQAQQAQRARRPLPGAAPAAAPRVRTEPPLGNADAGARARHRREPTLSGVSDLPQADIRSHSDAGADTDHPAADAALLNLRFLQAERQPGTRPGQSLRRIGQASRAWIAGSALAWSAALSSQVSRCGWAGLRCAGQAGRAVARLGPAVRLHVGRCGRLALRAGQRAVQAAGQGASWLFKHMAFRLRRPQPVRPAAPAAAEPQAWADDLALAWQQAEHAEHAERAERAELAEQAALTPPITCVAAAQPPSLPAQPARPPAYRSLRDPALATALQACRGAARGLARAATGHRWSGLPGLAASSALCLLVGAPQAWAGMVSGSSLQALQVAPTLLRSAFAADLNQAARAVAGQALAQVQAAKDRMDCEAGQPTAQAGAAAPAAAFAAAPAAALADASAAAAALTLALPPVATPQAAPSTGPRSRHRSLPRRARHACR